MFRPIHWVIFRSIQLYVRVQGNFIDLKMTQWMDRNMLSIQWFNKLSQFGYSTAVFCDCSIPIYIFCQHSGDEQAKVYYSIFIWSSTCFGRHTAHHQEPKTALAASGFAYVEGCWTCSWWTVCLTTSTNYTSNNPSRMQNQRLPVQF